MMTDILLSWLNNGSYTIHIAGNRQCMYVYMNPQCPHSKLNDQFFSSGVNLNLEIVTRGDGDASLMNDEMMMTNATFYIHLVGGE